LFQGNRIWSDYTDTVHTRFTQPDCLFQSAPGRRRSFRSRTVMPLTLWGLLLGTLIGPSASAVAPPLVQISPTLYQTEHCLFVIDASVTWSVPATAYNDLYAYPFPKLNNAYDALVAHFPGTYFSVCYIANTGDSHVPDYIDRTAKASGINESQATGTPNTFATTDFCRYNLPGGAVLKSTLGVYDHELGHAWGARAFYNTAPYPSLSNGHWLPNSTIDCQMGNGYSSDGYVTVNKLYGDPVNGFHWQKVDNLHSNDYETFSEQTLYLMGLNKFWPTAYVLNNVVYNADTTASYSSVDTFDHALMVAAYGARNPDYTTEQKRLKIAFVYIARDLAEVNTVYANVEASADQFCNAEVFDTQTYRFQTPFLCDTKFRASVDGLLSDLNGNASPTLSVTNTYVPSTDGAAVVNFVAADPDGPAPVVSVIPASTSCSIVGGTVQIAGLPDGVHFFTLKAVDAGGKKTFGHFVVEVQRPASSTAITVQPVGQTVAAGNAANFSVTATGTPASFTYQWFHKTSGTSSWNTLTDGGAFSGSATSTLTVATSTTFNKDEFLCVVSNATGTATSNSALLMVNETTPVLTTQPADRSVSSGTSVPLSVAAAGAPAAYGYFYYQWQRLAASGGSWTDLTDGGAYTGSTTASFRVVSSLAMNGDQFRCVVGNTAGSVTSTVATLTVGTTPVITTQPVSPVTIAAGQSASFTVMASGTAPLTYQWSRYGVPVAGATSATISFVNAQSSDAGAYTCSITNPFGSAGSNVGSLTVTATAPTISAQPQSAANLVGQSASFSVTASGSNPLAYQWRKNGVSIGGATGSSYTLSSAALSDAATYSVVVSNSAGSATSNGAVLTVSQVPAFTTQPAIQTVTAGNPVTFTSAASGTPAPTFQWQKGGVDIGGATNASYAIASAGASDAGSYSVVATNSAGSTSSNAATLTVNPATSPPAFTAQPASQTVTAGNPVTLTAAASGTPAPSFQWQKGGMNISGATGATYTIASPAATDAGSYTVVATNASGSATSIAAVLDVLVPPSNAVITITVE
jgi:hypothetical protein